MSITDELHSLCNTLVLALLDCPANLVQVQMTVLDSVMLFRINVPQEEFRKLLGKKGANIQALRLFMRSAGRKHGYNVTVEAIDHRGARV